MILRVFYWVASIASLAMAVSLFNVGLAYWVGSESPLEFFLTAYAALSFIVYLAAAAIPRSQERYSIFGLVGAGIGGTVLNVMGVRQDTGEFIALGLVAQAAFFFLVAVRTWKVAGLRRLALSAIAFGLLIMIIGGLVMLGAPFDRPLILYLGGAIGLLAWVVSPIFFWQLAIQLRAIGEAKQMSN